MKLRPIVPLNDNNMIKLKTQLTTVGDTKNATMMAVAFFMVSKTPLNIEQFSDVTLKQLTFDINEIVVIDTDTVLLLASNYRKFISPSNDWLRNKLTVLGDSAENFSDLLSINKFFSKEFMDSVSDNMKTFKLVNTLLNKCVKITD